MIRRVLLLTLAIVTCNVAAFAQTCPQGASWCSGTYAYDAMGNIRAIGADTYIYDTAGRLLSGTADVQHTGLVSQQDYTYDAFGNRTAASRTAGSVGCLGGCELSPTIDQNTTTNHITGSGAQYDAAGNLIFIQDTNNASYTYDAAGSLVHAVAGTDDRQFIYTADDERIATANGASWTWTVRGLDGKVLREFTSYQPPGGLPTSNWQWTKDYVWRDGLLLASVTPTTSGGTATQHFHLDHLGTPRLVTGNNGVQLSVHVYYPFGAELNLTPSEQPAELMKFTGHERDLLANDPHTLDYMHARFYNPTVGRFLSTDPALKTRSAMRLPQIWNRYSYVSNNPLHHVDPTGAVAALPSNCADNKTACKEIRDLRNGVPLELRMFIRATTVNGRTVIDNRYMRMMRGAISQNFQALRLVVNDPSVTHISSSQSRYSPIAERGEPFGTSLASLRANGITLLSGLSSPNDDNYIYVDAALGRRNAAGVLAHEIRHAKLFLLGLPYDHTEEQSDGTFVYDSNSVANIETAAAKAEAYRNYDQSIPPL
jgi:RHS repeat-associated protein